MLAPMGYVLRNLYGKNKQVYRGICCFQYPLVPLLEFLATEVLETCGLINSAIVSYTGIFRH